MLANLTIQSLPPFEEILKRYPDFFEQGLTAKEAAALIDTTPAALAQMRTRSTGPPYHRLPTITSTDRRDRPRGPIRYIRRETAPDPRWTNNWAGNDGY